MHLNPRIPILANDSFQAMSDWFGAMYAGDMLFHPDDPPVEIYWISADVREFTDIEAKILNDILAQLFAMHGDRVYDAAYPYFMRAAHGDDWAIKIQ